MRIGMLMCAHVVGTVNVVSVLAMAPVIQRELGLSATHVGFLMAGYYSGQAIWSLPAGAFVRATLTNAKPCCWAFRLDTHFQCHWSERVRLRGQPIGFGQEKLSSRVEFHDRAVEDSAQRSDQFIAEWRGTPLDGIHAERTRSGDRAYGIPPDRKRLGVEEGSGGL